MGVADDWLAGGRYALVVAGETVPATLGTPPFFDPKGERIRA
jgi:hypothetical protein